jgi:hypothetical protein
MKIIVFLGALIIFVNNALAQAYISDGNSNWLTDKISNCTTYNSNPKVGETIRWYGACKNGLIEGYGRLEWYVDNKLTQLSIGEYSAGKVEGRVKMTTYIESRIQWEYDGYFVNDLYDGLGHYRFPSGSTYTGEWSKGKPHGVGTFNFKSGKKFIGELVNNKRHGMGVEYEESGKILKEGIWSEGNFLYSQSVSTSLISRANIIESELKIKKSTSKEHDLRGQKCKNLGLTEGTRDFQLCIKTM